MPTKDTQLQIRVSAAEKAAIRTAAERAGMDVSAWVLSRALPRRGKRFRELLQALVEDPTRRRFSLAALNDLLTSTPASAFPETVGEPPGAPWDEWTANYVAAMTETAAHRLKVTPPAWTATVVPLARPWFSSPFPGLRLHLLLASPPAFRRRNLFVDSTIGDRV